MTAPSTMGQRFVTLRLRSATWAERSSTRARRSCCSTSCLVLTTGSMTARLIMVEALRIALVAAFRSAFTCTASGRSPGSLARSFKISSDSALGMSLFTSCGTGGAECTCFSITSIGVLPAKGSCPVSMWKHSTPKA